MSVPEETDALVVGAGVAGLSAALALDARGLSVSVVEARERIGGAVYTESVGDYRVERGASTMRVSAEALAALQLGGAEPALLKATPESRSRYLVRSGALAPLGLAALWTRGHLSGRACLRLLAEPFRRRGDGAAESVAEFVSRRLGPEVATRLVSPFLIGVYAGRAEALGAEAVFPSLVAYERSAGSIAAGALGNAIRGGPAGLPGTWSAREGLGSVASQLARGLQEPVHTGVRVESLRHEDGAFRACVGGPEHSREIRASRLVVATEAFAAATLLSSLDEEMASLCGSLEYGPLVSVALAIEPMRARVPLEGFGFLVPEEEGLDLLGMLFMSRLFPGRAPEGRVLTTAMIGGARWPGAVDAADSEILSRIGAGAERILGVRGDLEPIAITRWPRAVPWPGVAHRARVRRLRERQAAFPGLALAGGWLDGVGVSHALASGLAAGASA
ncbi:MAG: protoporphyrinogen oxidase [Myxococcota bacterium]|nr:protoporphyrinogen oxidase [Myxococcota bacterium]